MAISNRHIIYLYLTNYKLNGYESEQWIIIKNIKLYLIWHFALIFEYLSLFLISIDTPILV